MVWSKKLDVLVLVLELGATIAEEGAGQADDRQVEREVVAGAPFEDLTAVIAMVDVAVDEGELALQAVVRAEERILVEEVAGNAAGEEGVLELVLERQEIGVRIEHAALAIEGERPEIELTLAAGCEKGVRRVVGLALADGKETAEQAQIRIAPRCMDAALAAELEIVTRTVIVIVGQQRAVVLDIDIALDREVGSKRQADATGVRRRTRIGPRPGGHAWDRR